MKSLKVAVVQEINNGFMVSLQDKENPKETEKEQYFCSTSAELGKLCTEILSKSKSEAQKETTKITLEGVEEYLKKLSDDLKIKW